MAIKKTSELKIPAEYNETHFPHLIKKDWYLIPVEAQMNEDLDRKFECWLFNSNGTLAAVPYLMTSKDLGFSS